MKKIHIYIASLILLATSFAGCKDWLDVDPVDKTKESTQYSTESGVNSVMNGLYRAMDGNTLYGGHLTRTLIECMANRYVYYSTYVNGTYAAYTINNWSKYLWDADSYTNSDVESQATAIWGNGYSLAFDVNNFLKSLRESSVSLTEDKRNILNGEAYAIRAYIHFDLFRLFGPVYTNADATTKIMPYNSLMLDKNFEEEMFLLTDQTAPAFMDSVLTDINRAETLLEKSDPIITDFSTAVTTELSSGNFYTQNRNRRMNYYAVRALKARVLQYMGRTDEAVQIAQSIIDKVGTVGADNTTLSGFALATDISSDYTLFSEVIFGLHDLSMYSKAEGWFTSVTAPQSGYFTSNHYITNIYDLSSGGDYRSSAMKNAGINLYVYPNLSSVWYGNRFSSKTSDTRPAGLYFQPLIRLSEMYYIVAEKYIDDSNFTAAASLLNVILAARGVDNLYSIGGANNPDLPNENSYTTDNFMKFLRKEYYREFGYEGQIFFFYKRHNSSQMLYSNFYDVSNMFQTLENPTVAYTLPIPSVEANY